MEIWVQNVKTGEAWILDNDPTKDVYEDKDGIPIYKGGMWNYKYYPINPNLQEKEKTGYQFNIMDYLEGGGNG